MCKYTNRLKCEAVKKFHSRLYFNVIQEAVELVLGDQMKQSYGAIKL